MKSFSLIVCMILMIGNLIHVYAVTDAELEALEKQIEQQEAEEKKQAEAKANEKRKAEEKRLSELEKQRLKEEQKRLEEERRKLEEEKRKLEEARLTELERKQQEEEAERQRLAAEEARLKKEANKEAKKLAGEMVDVPGGSFQMGDISGTGSSDEKPVHTVTIKPFKMGKHEVTFGHWDACVSDGGCNGYSPEDRWGRGKQPVTFVSWHDAQSFVNWLNGKTGGGYRLPSEAEWEYAARAGTETQYHWGNDVGRNHANCRGCGSQWKNTAPVGSFTANAFGLHDMHSNVWEWLQDCWHDNYNGAPSDGSAWEGGDCANRSTRSGSYDNGPKYMRSAYRGYLRNDGTVRFSGLGFRLAQDL